MRRAYGEAALAQLRKEVTRLAAIVRTTEPDVYVRDRPVIVESIGKLEAWLAELKRELV